MYIILIISFYFILYLIIIKIIIILIINKIKKEAILNLKQTTKEVYKENLRMADALRYHVMEGEDLQKLNNQLSITNKQLLEEKDLNSIIVKEKIMQSKKQNDQVKFNEK